MGHLWLAKSPLLQLRSDLRRSPHGSGRKKEIPGWLAKPAKAVKALALTTGAGTREIETKRRRG